MAILVRILIFWTLLTERCFSGQEREQDMTTIVMEIQERMRTERTKLETVINDIIDEADFGDVKNSQNVNMVNDVHVKLGEHLDRFEEAKEKDENNNKDIWEIIENQIDTINTIEDKTKQMFSLVSELENIDGDNINNELSDLKSKDETEARHLSDLESRVDSLTEKVNNFVQNVMIVRSLPQKVMNIQNNLNRLEEKLKV
jgi:type IV secretory pathway VirJ component